MGKIIYDLPNEEYHSSDAISKSGLDEIAHSPAHYKAMKEAQEDDKQDSDALIFGSAFHDYILLPNVFQQTYVVLPEDFNGRTKAGKAYLEELKEANKVILKFEWMNNIEAMAASLANHPKSSTLLNGGSPEVSIFWKDKATGIDCRCRPDYIHSKGILVDLKTTLDASPKAFARTVVNHRYHVQDAFYSEGFKQATGAYPRGFVFIAVEKKPPYAVSCYELDGDAKSLGRELYENDLNTFLEAKTTDTWKAYSQEIETLSLPAWAFRG